MTLLAVLAGLSGVAALLAWELVRASRQLGALEDKINNVSDANKAIATTIEEVNHATAAVPDVSAALEFLRNRSPAK